MKMRNTKIKMRKNNEKADRQTVIPERVILIPETRTRNFYDTRPRSKSPKIFDYPKNPTRTRKPGPESELSVRSCIKTI